MKIRTRIIVGTSLVAAVSLYYLVRWIQDGLRPQYLKTTEESLVDTARTLASFAAHTSKTGNVDVELFRAAFSDAYGEAFAATIYDFTKTAVDFRLYITDTAGKVIFDSANGRDEGQDYSAWRDVKLTLQGEYGARASRDLPGDALTSVLYIAAPIKIDGKLSGALTVGKPTTSATQFIDAAKTQITTGGLITMAVLLVVVFILSEMIARPIQRLTMYARAVRDGRRVSAPPRSSSETGELAAAFEEMRDALEGKQYVENYVQTLTHEIKSPVSGIQGAVELLKEDMTAERRAQFINNIRSDTERIKVLIEKMLLLSSLEKRKEAIDLENLDLLSIVQEALARLKPQTDAKRLQLSFLRELKSPLKGEKFLLDHAVQNLLQNAIEFTPEGGRIEISIEEDRNALRLSISDSGCGVPEYAKSRIFDRFYSLKRPDTGKKSSGLGLSLVREVAELHNGTVALENGPQGGAIAQLVLPRGL